MITRDEKYLVQLEILLLAYELLHIGSFMDRSDHDAKNRLIHWQVMRS